MNEDSFILNPFESDSESEIQRHSESSSSETQVEEEHLYEKFESSMTCESTEDHLSQVEHEVSIFFFY